MHNVIRVDFKGELAFTLFHVVENFASKIKYKMTVSLKEFFQRIP